MPNHTFVSGACKCGMTVCYVNNICAKNSTFYHLYGIYLIMKKTIVSILITAIISNAVFAQLWTKGALEQSDWNLSLKKMKVGDTLEKEYYPCFGGKYDAVLASSWLSAEGNPPRTLKANEKDENGDSWDESEIDWANKNRYDSWTEMYGPGKCFDGKTDTAWCEGKSDDGIGEVVIAWVDVKRPVRIWSGFGKSEKLWKENNRPKDIKVFVIQGEVIGHSVNSPNYKMKVVGEKTLTLKDVNGWQKLNLDEYKEIDSEEFKKLDPYELSQSGTFLAIKILSVYPGTKYKDTLISEVSN